MAELPGVNNSLDQMARWATRERYSIIKILSDETKPVTAPLINEQLSPILSEEIDRIVVYFVGHGFLNSPDQIWIISNGPEVNTGRISRDALRASISTYRPKQISMIADACLESRHFPSGTVPVIYDAPGPRRRVFVDSIFSTLPNDPSFFFRGKKKDADFCLFTSVLVDFLNGEDERAFRLANGVLPNVTTQTLYWNLPDAVLERGAIHGVDQEPRVEPGFPQGDDVYSTFGEAGAVRGPQPSGGGDDAAQPPDPSSPPPDGDVRRHLRDSIPLEGRTTEIGSSTPTLLEESQIEQLKAEAFHWNGRLAALINREGSKASWGIIINEAPTGFFTGPIRDSDGRSIWYPILRSDLDKIIPYEGRRPGSILTISWSTRWQTEGAEFFVMAPIFEGLIATIHLADEANDIEGGCKQLSWSPDYTSHLYSAKTLTAWRALIALTRGKLMHADAALIADGLRDEKHINPMIGIVCAYLYDLIGDLDSLSRLCHFYVQHDQGIPFDIAILSGGQLRRSENSDGWELSYESAKEDSKRADFNKPRYLWRSTPKGVGRVAGATPLVRAGWSRLGTHEDAVLREFAQMADTLTSSPIATLMGRDVRDHATELLRDLRIM
jgi:hypothetical protein